jgi:asparagine synthase (glutamine-hydrolysing)
MAKTLRHRGPDDAGLWTDAAAGVALAHRRLSIVDLSSAGHQPMVSESGRYVITYNGEIYNAPDLGVELGQSRIGAARFRGHSDTEVMLACVERWGVESSLERWNGMFAFALWDRKERALYLARDRFGEKPLYYAWFGQTVLFASELKALRAHPRFKPEIDRNSVALFLRHNCIPAPSTIYRHASKLPPACFLRITSSSQPNQRPVAYWSLREVIEHARENPFRGTNVEAAEEAEFLLSEAVRIRTFADVPIGVFLSGGIDSSVVAALMQKCGARKARSFSIAMKDAAYDESHEAAAVANHLGTEHCQLLATPEEALAVIRYLPKVYDEPFADSSQIPTLLLAQLARRHVAVALSGDGGDELFGGYNRHVWGKEVGLLINKTPLFLRRITAMAVGKVSTQMWDRGFDFARAALPKRMRHRAPGYKLHKLARILTAPDTDTAYQILASHWTDPVEVMRDFEGIGSEPSLPESLRALTPEEQMMYLDTVTYLPNDILVKVDRATMAASLESRAPFLDPRVVEFAWRLSLRRKISKGRGKQVLRDVLYRHIPQAMVDRPKSGFGIPLSDWLRGPLRDWAEDLLDERRIRNEGYFCSQPIRTIWQQHLSGHGAWEFHLWDILMFEIWLEESRRIPSSETETVDAQLAS